MEFGSFSVLVSSLIVFGKWGLDWMTCGLNFCWNYRFITSPSSIIWIDSVQPSDWLGRFAIKLARWCIEDDVCVIVLRRTSREKFSSSNCFCRLWLIRLAYRGYHLWAAIVEQFEDHRIRFLLLILLTRWLILFI